MCTHCSSLLKDPVQTSETGKRYCKECFNIVRYVSISTFTRISGAREGRGWPPLNKLCDGFPAFALSVLPVGHCMEGMYG